MGKGRLEAFSDGVRPGGVLMSTVSEPPAQLVATRGVRGITFIVRPDRAELVELARLIDVGRLTPVVESVFPLDRAREAL